MKLAFVMVYSWIPQKRSESSLDDDDDAAVYDILNLDATRIVSVI